MDKETSERLINLLKKDRKKVIQILINILEDFDCKLKVPNELLEELFIKKEKKKIDEEEKQVSMFIVDSETKKIYKYFDFSDFTYEDLYINTERSSDNSLNIMRDNNIVFSTKNIINKVARNCNFENICIKGNFDGWNIELSDFGGCMGLPTINPNKTANKSINGVTFGNTIVSGNCDGVDITGASFLNAVISKDFSINPQTIKDKDLSRTILSGVKIVGNFDGATIRSTDFRGCKTELLLHLDKINPGSNKELKYNYFGGITFEGDLAEYELVSNDFTGSKNAVIDFNKVSFIQTSSKWNNFADVTFKNIYRAGNHFLYDNNNKFANSYISYDSYNCSSELRWYENLKEAANFKDIILINEDKELEDEIKKIIKPEIIKQKIKKMESNQ